MNRLESLGTAILISTVLTVAIPGVFIILWLIGWIILQLTALYLAVPHIEMATGITLAFIWLAMTTGMFFTESV